MKRIIAVIVMMVLCVVTGKMAVDQFQTFKNNVDTIERNRGWYDEDTNCGWNEKLGYYTIIESPDDMPKKIELGTIHPEYKSIVAFNTEEEMNIWTSWRED